MLRLRLSCPYPPHVVACTAQATIKYERQSFTITNAAGGTFKIRFYNVVGTSVSLPWNVSGSDMWSLIRNATFPVDGCYNIDITRATVPQGFTWTFQFNCINVNIRYPDVLVLSSLTAAPGKVVNVTYDAPVPQSLPLSGTYLLKVGGSLPHTRTHARTHAARKASQSVVTFLQV
jgi:hypothetical protein